MAEFGYRLAVHEGRQTFEKNDTWNKVRLSFKTSVSLLCTSAGWLKISGQSIPEKALKFSKRILKVLITTRKLSNASLANVAKFRYSHIVILQNVNCCDFNWTHFSNRDFHFSRMHSLSAYHTAYDNEMLQLELMNTKVNCALLDRISAGSIQFVWTNPYVWTKLKLRLSCLLVCLTTCGSSGLNREPRQNKTVLRKAPSADIVPIAIELNGQLRREKDNKEAHLLSITPATEIRYIA